MFETIKTLLSRARKGREHDSGPQAPQRKSKFSTTNPQPAPVDTDAALAAGVLPAVTGDNAILAGELQAARKIQMSLVPKTFPPIPGCLLFDLYAILEPAKEIGGDFYDFWMNGRENLVLVVGDVSGKGIPSALFMAVCRTYLRAFSKSVREPAKLLEYLNNEVSRHNESCMFVTLVCAVVHIPTGKVHYANAGHNPPMIRKVDGTVGMLEMACDPPIGFMHGTTYTTRSLRLAPGDSLLFYTDGMPEAFNSNGDIMGEERALDLFRRSSRDGACRSAIGHLRSEIAEFTGKAVQSDDITLMMYGQMSQTADANMMTVARGQFPRPDALHGESGMFSLSDFSDLVHRTRMKEKAGFDEDLGQSLSGFVPGNDE